MNEPDIGYLLNQAARSLRVRLAEKLAPSGLTPQQAAALLAIDRAEGATTPTALADAIGTDPATTSGLVGRLERDGWVVVEPNPADGRSRVITLAERGSGVLPAVRHAAEAASAEAVSCLAPADVATLTALLARLCADDAGDAPGADR